MDFIEITFKAEVDISEMIISLLMNNGFEGVEIDENLVKAYINENQFNELIIKNIFYKFKVEFAINIIPYKNWNEEWEANFLPVQVGNFVNVRASFHPKPTNMKYDIIINPKMSFGTGHHATTWLMMQEMEQLDFKEKYVIDFGTGTGILAILAEKLGAAHILAIDNDENCIINARENFRLNDCNNINLAKAETISGKASIILANINKNIILTNCKRIISACDINGYILLSGLLKDDYDDITKIFVNSNMLLIHHAEKDNWISLLYRYTLKG
ncbi:MAG: 50S ribosomal protein L11 methyltransferase [Ferruginibacter sp.]